MAEKAAIKGKIYKCPTCGSVLCFDPKSQKLKCTHCNSLQELVNVTGAFEINYTSQSEQGYTPWGDAKTVKCRSCGAEFAVNEYETAKSCPFCGTSNVIMTDDIPGIKPNAILPFKITQDEAMESYQKWLKGRLMSPHNLKKLAQKKTMQGIYVPIFTFDTQTHSTYTIRYGVNRTIVIRQGDRTVTKVVTDWYVDSGRHAKFYNDVQIEASQFLSQKNLNKVGGFDSNNAKMYNPQYIAGFSAERYSTGLDESWDQAKEYIDDWIKSDILNRYNYDILDYVNISTSYSEKTYKYMLAPMWTLTYNYKGKEYGCVVNGRTGEADGRAPLSPLKVATVSILAAGALAGIIYLIYTYLMR